MSPSAKLLFLTTLLVAVWAHDVEADRKTVCSITVNSPDEQAMFRRSLPADKFQFVELVERGRPDWLASACQRQIHCDVLVISGHYDGGNEFFSDRAEASEFLPVDEMERVSCSDSCPGLFSQLKEVYLFGCNTLNPGANKIASAEIERSLVRSGHSPADAERLVRVLGMRHGESSRDRMRLIFMNVPAIYGFSSVAPVGPRAAAILGRHFQTNGTGEVGTGRASARLLGQFGGHAMVVTSGLNDADPQAAYRQDICQFADDRLSAAQKLDFVHRLLGREMAEVRMFLDSIEEYVASLPAIDLQTPTIASALDEIVRDRGARARYLEFARDADQLAIRVRMMKLAQRLGWLSSAELRAELIQMIGRQLGRGSMSAADLDLVCALNEGHELDGELHRLQLRPEQRNRTDHAAVLACLGNADGRARVLEALTSADDREVELAQIYLYHEPITDVTELRAVSKAIVEMQGSPAQIRAIDTLARHRLSDRQSLEEMIRLFSQTGTVGVQTAIASVLIRADYRAFATPELVETLRRSRLRPPQSEDLIDVLIRRLQAL
jgi:hypothetical protein